MKGIHLPRGLDERNLDLPMATARWASSAEILRYAYQPGDIWLGTLPVPHEDAVPALRRLYALQDHLAQLEQLDEGWRAEQLATCRHHIEVLGATDCIPVGVNDDRHLVTIGSTRAGKGTSVIVPNLCLYPGSVICIDPKGENARLTAARRGGGSRAAEGLGQGVCILDPYDTTGLPAEMKASWNPLDLLVPGDPQFVDKGASIAESLIVRSSEEHAHFDDSSRMFAKGLILYVAVRLQGRAGRNLVTVHDLLMRGAWAQMEADRGAAPPQPDDPDAFTYLLHLMKRSEECDGIIAGAATMLLAMGDRERGGVLSTARRNLEFIERRAMRQVLMSSSFDLDHIKTNPAGMTIYLCLPPHRMPDCGRWLRLMIGAGLERMYELRDASATGHPVLFLLEEFASLRHMEIIEHAAGYAAGFGVKLWVIVQDLAQLRRHYRDGWETFLGNAGLIQAFANSDATTLSLLSNKLGQVEMSRNVRNVSSSLATSTNEPADLQRMQGLLHMRGPMGLVAAPLSLFTDHASHGQSATTTTAWNENVQRCPLLLPDEIERLFRREAMTQIVVIKGERPMALCRENYFESDRFARYVGDGGAVLPPQDVRSDMEDRRRAVMAATDYSVRVERQVAAAGTRR